MIITRKQLRQVIKEELAHLFEVEYDERRHDARELVEEYRMWLRQEDLMYPEDSARAMASYIIDMGYFDKLTDDPRGGTSRGMGRNRSLESAFESYYGVDSELVNAEVMELLEDVMSGEELRVIGADYDEAGNLINNDDYPKILGYEHPETGEKVMINVQTRDDMDDILDPLLDKYPDLPFSVD
jgi:hypothetical protein